MLLPDKHIRLSESLLGLGSFLLGLIRNPVTVDGIWLEYRKARDSGAFPAHHTFENVVLALDVLFTIGAIDVQADGLIKKCA